MRRNPSAQAQYRIGLGSVGMERKLPFLEFEIAACTSTKRGFLEKIDRQSTSWPVFSNLSRRAFSPRRTLGRLSSSRLAAAFAARAVRPRPWAADVGGLSWDVDRP